MKLKTILLILSVLILALTLTGGFFYYQTAKIAAIQHNHINAVNLVIETAGGVDSYMTEKKGVLKRLAAIPALEKALNKTNQVMPKEANLSLDNFCKALGKSICYIIDDEGNVTASSNRLLPDSFIGNNYSFRPYFKEALKGRPGIFMGIGVTSKKPGLYLSHPITDSETDRIIGVAAVKFPVDEIYEPIKLSGFNGIIALTGPHSIIFHSNRDDLVGKFLWEPSQTEREKTASSRQFGAGPFPSSGFSKDKNNANQAVDREGNTYTVHQHEVETLPGWHLIFLHDNTEFISSLSATLTRKVGGTIAASLILIVLLVSLLYTMASVEINRRRQAEEKLLENKKNLELTVEKRTAELREANEDLQHEVEEHRRDSKKLEYSNKTLEILNQVLQISQETITLQEFLNEFIQIASSFSEFGLQPKGALFLTDNDNPNTLQMKAQFNLSETLLAKCKNVPYGRCLCGKAAETGEIVFAGDIDARHNTTYEGIMPHGHYCIPILSKNKKLLGVYNVYTKPGSFHDKRVEKLLVSIASVLASIIEYKKAGHKIRESHERYRAITNSVHDAIIMIDHQDKITFWNPAAEKIFGYKIEKILGEKLHDLIVPERYRDKAKKGLEKFLKTGKGPLINQTMELSCKRKNGEEFPVELSVSALRQGNRWSSISILRDITERKTTEAERRKMEQQLRQAQKMEAIGTLAGGIAHDFNNILSSILGYADLVKEELPESCRENVADVELIIKAGNRAKELVRQILTFSRQTEEEIHPIQVSLVIKEALKLLRASLPSDIAVRQMISAGSAMVLADPTQIHQLIMNLCTNSYQAMRENGGTLTVRLESYAPDEHFRGKYPNLLAEQYLRLTVSDTGRGMDPSIIPRIFDPYFSTNKKEDGTGLGLAVVHGIVQRLGGVIEVYSAVDAGTTFDVFLPVFKGALEYGEPQPITTSLEGNESILLVDDEQPILQLEERMLSSLGYKITCRTSSVEALELFRNQPDKFDLIVTDHSMPNMTGIKLAEAINDIRPDIPIILCTGYFELDISKEAEGKSIRKIIMKPVNKEKLGGAIRAELDRKD